VLAKNCVGLLSLKSTDFLTMETTLTEQHLNGFSHKDLGTTEVLVSSDINTYVFDTICAIPSVNDDGVRGIPEHSPKQVLRFIRLNYSYLRHRGLPGDKAFQLAYLRWCAVKEALVSPNFDPADYFVHYTEAKFIPLSFDDLPFPFRIREEGETLEDYQSALAAAKLAYVGTEYGIDEKERRARGQQFANELIAQFSDELNDKQGAWSRAQIDTIRDQFGNIVCMLAFVFRSRGHHYLPTYESIYRRLWSSCGQNPDQMICTFQELFTIGLHAIYPIILDDFWIFCVRNGYCSGSLKKRLDCAAAGSAFVYALYNGLNDILTVFPKLREDNLEPFTRLKTFYERLHQLRWIGSINHTFYGSTRETIDENLFSALASIVVGVYREFVPQSPLLSSLSLQRIGNNAPLVGGVIGTALRALTRSEKFQQKYIESQTRRDEEEGVGE